MKKKRGVSDFIDELLIHAAKETKFEINHDKLTTKQIILAPIFGWEEATKMKSIVYDDTPPIKGKLAEVYFGNWKNNNEPVAIKSQIIRDPTNLSDVAYRELIIFQTLNVLQGSVELLDWFKTDGGRFADGALFMNYVLRKAGEPLVTFAKQKIELSQYKSILFQVLYFLYEAQTKFEFIHHDLHAKNILIQLDKNTTTYSFNDKKYVNREGVVVKITDYGISRIQIPETKEVIYNTAIGSDSFTPSVDLIKVKDSIGKLKLNWPLNSEKDEKELTMIKKIMGKDYSSVNWNSLLGSPFFDSMML